MEEKNNDLVNHPKHYTCSKSGVEVIEVTRHLTGSLSNAWKYCCRYLNKGTPKQDLEKAIFYLNDCYNHIPAHSYTCNDYTCLNTLLPKMKAFIDVEEVLQIRDVMSVIRKVIVGELTCETIIHDDEFQLAVTALGEYAKTLA